MITQLIFLKIIINKFVSLIFNQIINFTPIKKGKFSMFYKSTRDSQNKVTSAQAIIRGLSSEGGLFVPESFPQVTTEEMLAMQSETYNQRAIRVLKKFLTDFSNEQIETCVANAYTTKKFETENIAEFSHLLNDRFLLELWHGPTCAFKDMALQLLPQLLKTSAKITENDKEIVILVATSGDTGKAALEGFKDVDGTKIIVFYPRDGVSSMQKRQMTTQEGENVYVCSINGNFDDAQTAVKSIFTDKELARKMEQSGKFFSSANSINWGRLVPQIIYYVSSYCQLVAEGKIKQGDNVNVVVPTGNFGNILACYYAKKMGIPFGKLICASNKNKVLTDFINTGVYDKNRDFYATNSPSMDILISSNLERLLYDLSGENDEILNSWYTSLKNDGKYTVSEDVKQKLQSEFFGGFCNDEETQETIKDLFDKYYYLCDTHTAVAVKVFDDYTKQTGDKTPAIIVSTASPYKFTESVLSAIKKPENTDEYDQILELNKLSELEIPLALKELKTAKVRFEKSIEKAEIKTEVQNELGI